MIVGAPLGKDIPCRGIDALGKSLNDHHGTHSLNTVELAFR